MSDADEAAEFFQNRILNILEITVPQKKQNI